MKIRTSQNGGEDRRTGLWVSLFLARGLSISAAYPILQSVIVPLTPGLGLQAASLATIGGEVTSGGGLLSALNLRTLRAVWRVRAWRRVVFIGVALFAVLCIALNGTYSLALPHINVTMYTVSELAGTTVASCVIEALRRWNLKPVLVGVLPLAGGILAVNPFAEAAHGVPVGAVSMAALVGAMYALRFEIVRGVKAVIERLVPEDMVDAVANATIQLGSFFGGTTLLVGVSVWILSSGKLGAVLAVISGWVIFRVILGGLLNTGFAGYVETKTQGADRLRPVLQGILSCVNPVSAIIVDAAGAITTLYPGELPTDPIKWIGMVLVGVGSILAVKSQAAKSSKA